MLKNTKNKMIFFDTNGFVLEAQIFVEKSGQFRFPLS